MTAASVVRYFTYKRHTMKEKESSSVHTVWRYDMFSFIGDDDVVASDAAFVVTIAVAHMSPIYHSELRMKVLCFVYE